MSEVLARWNGMEAGAAAEAVLPCCGSQAWARTMAARRPLLTAEDVTRASDAAWWGLGEADRAEAFGSHPRIGEVRAAGAATEQSLGWSGEEQGRVMSADEQGKAALAEGNRRYEEQFGRIFLICANGRGAGEILRQMEQRMGNDPETEMRLAAEEQRKITELRLRRWMGVEG